MTIEQRADYMLDAWHACHPQWVTTACQVWDITEDEPIPKGEVVSIEDFDSSGDGETSYFIVCWNDRIYIAEPSDLWPWS